MPRLLAHQQFVGHHLEPHQAAYAREQRRVVDRLGEKIIGAGIEPGQPVGRLIERRHHDDGDVRGFGIGFDAAADFETVHARHHHVEQHDVGRLGGDALERFLAVMRGDDLEILGRQLRFEQLDVGENVVNDENARCHVLPQPRKRRTVSRKLVTEIGFEI